VSGRGESVGTRIGAAYRVSAAVPEAFAVVVSLDGGVAVVTNRQSDSLIAPLVAETGGRTVIQEPQRGTGHAVQVALAAMPAADGTVVVAYGDSLVLRDPNQCADDVTSRGRIAYNVESRRGTWAWASFTCSTSAMRRCSSTGGRGHPRFPTTSALRFACVLLRTCSRSCGLIETKQ